MLYEEFEKIGEYAAMGAFENESESLFCRKALGIRRYYENCKLYEYNKELLYPSGVKSDDMIITPYYLNGLNINWSMVTDENKPLIQKYKNDFCLFSSKVPSEHTVAGNMWCHSIPNYGRIIKEGLDSYMVRINKMKDEN